MDALVEHDVELSRRTSPKLAQAFEMMEAGLRLKRAALEHQHPTASRDEQERMFSKWLLADE